MSTALQVPKHLNRLNALLVDMLHTLILNLWMTAFPALTASIASQVRIKQTVKKVITAPKERNSRLNTPVRMAFT